MASNNDEMTKTVGRCSQSGENDSGIVLAAMSHGVVLAGYQTTRSDSRAGQAVAAESAIANLFR